MMITKDKVTREAILGLNQLLKYYQRTNNAKYLDRLKEAIPMDLLDNPTVRSLISEVIHDYRIKTSKVKVNGKKSILFWC